jgi:hypothetical protein
MLKEKPERLRKALSKKAKLVVGIVPAEGAEPDSIRKWHSDHAGQDVRNDAAVVGEALEFLQEEGARSVAMADRIIGCPHEEGIGSVAKNDDGERRRGYRSSQIAASPKFRSIRRTSPIIPS